MQERKMNLVFKTTKDNSAKYYNSFLGKFVFLINIKNLKSKN